MYKQFRLRFKLASVYSLSCRSRVNLVTPVPQIRSKTGKPRHENRNNAKHHTPLTYHYQSSVPHRHSVISSKKPCNSKLRLERVTQQILGLVCRVLSFLSLIQVIQPATIVEKQLVGRKRGFYMRLSLRYGNCMFFRASWSARGPSFVLRSSQLQLAPQL